MTCREARANLSLYLYGELDFAGEEALSAHLDGCAACALELQRERTWHDAAAAEQADTPLHLLSKCRGELHESLSVISEAAGPRWLQWIDSLGLRPSPWSMRLAMASLLVCLGFGLSRLVARGELLHSDLSGGTVRAAGLDPARARVRFIVPESGGNVQIVVDEMRERVVTGAPEDQPIRQLLLSAVKDPSDPALRADSVDILKHQSGVDIRDALLDAAEHDPNAGVRLKAVEGLGPYSDESPARRALAAVLAHDNNPDVRAQAINLLLPVSGSVTFSPQLAGTLQELMRTEPDGYIRNRCQRALQTMNASLEIY